jgi:threonine/homoserine/homoserine lactone efflux protein
MSLPVDPHLYATFLATMAVMAITPGPANVFAVATGVEKGKAAALLGVAGMNTATLVWFGAAALGLGALVLAFPQAFRLVAIAGGLYVAWLGIRAILAALKGERASAHATVKPGENAFRDGFTVQISNPKAILFFTAVLPPFLDPHRPVWPQLLMFACATIGMDVMSMSAYGLGGAALAERMERPAFRRGFGLFVGALLLTASALILIRQ